MVQNRLAEQFHPQSDPNNEGSEEITAVREIQSAIAEQEPVSIIIHPKPPEPFEQQPLEQLQPSDIDELIYNHEELATLPNESAGMQMAHELFMETLYSKQYLPLLKVLHERIHRFGNKNMEMVYKAVELYENALEVVEEVGDDKDISLSEAFGEVYEGATQGMNDFLIALRRAREAAINCIRTCRVYLQDKEWGVRADKALAEYAELKNGLDFPPEFAEKLADPQTKSLVVSLDFNSTFNVGESYPHGDLVGRTQRSLHSFARAFRKQFPEKELYVTVNTGRPGPYAWGTLEASFAPIEEMRKVALAEVGGVVMSDVKSGVMDVAVPDPEGWKRGLELMKDYLLELIENPEDVAIEPKLSMLSMKLAENGEYLLKSKTGQDVTPELIQKWLDSFFTGKRDYCELIEARYNPTAGYMDIGHKWLNKYSTLMGYVCEQEGAKPDEVLFVQIGDSTTDILPEEYTGTGEPNEGADDAYLVAVNNCNAKVDDAVSRRGVHGLKTQNSSLLGAEAFFRGLKRVVRSCE